MTELLDFRLNCSITGKDEKERKTVKVPGHEKVDQFLQSSLTENEPAEILGFCSACII